MTPKRQHEIRSHVKRKGAVRSRQMDGPAGHTHTSLGDNTAMQVLNGVRFRVFPAADRIITSRPSSNWLHGAARGLTSEP